MSAVVTDRSLFRRMGPLAVGVAVLLAGCGNADAAKAASAAKGCRRLPPFTCDPGGKRVQQSLAIWGLEFCRGDSAAACFTAPFEDLHERSKDCQGG